MQHQGQGRRRVDRGVVHAQPLRQVGRHRDAAIGVGDLGAVQDDPAVARQGLHLLARAIAHVGQEAVQAHLRRGGGHRRASNTLYPPESARRSTLAKMEESRAS